MNTPLHNKINLNLTNAKLHVNKVGERLNNIKFNVFFVAFQGWIGKESYVKLFERAGGNYVKEDAKINANKKINFSQKALYKMGWIVYNIFINCLR